MKRVVRSLRSLTPRGFTLPEVLVTVAIIAVLASAVIPSVVGQLKKGDAAALSSDLSSIQTAITNFTSATRSFPATITDLNTQPSSSANNLCATTYGTNIANWKGPYLAGAQSATAFTSSTRFKTSAYNLSVSDGLSIQDHHIAINVLNSTGGLPDSATISQLKQAVDGVAGNWGTGTTNGTSGLVRFTNSGSTFVATDSVYILLVPVASGC